MLNNPQLRVVVESIDRYRNGTLDLWGVHLNLRAVSTAIEGDVPKRVRDEVERAEGRLEEIHFMSGDRERVEGVLQQLEEVLVTYYPREEWERSET